MTSGYVLILAVLLLGGVIATLGDRIGMRVGKARLTLFNLRPRQTATVVSVFTGSLISASTLGLLFAVSEQLRTGVFELQQIQDDLAQTRQELQEAEQERSTVEETLETARQEQAEAQDQLQQINQSLQTAIQRQTETEAQLEGTRSRLTAVSQEAAQLQGEISQLQQERQALVQEQSRVQAQIEARDQEIARRDQEIDQRNQEIAQREREIAERNQRLEQLASEQTQLSTQISRLEQEAEGLRSGDVALGRNQSMLFPRIVQLNPSDLPQARQVVEALLQEANQVAIQRILPGTVNIDDQVIEFDPAEANQMVNQLAEGRPYILRVISNANYFVGESCVIQGLDPCISVTLDATLNQRLFEAGDVLATVNVEDGQFTDRGLFERYVQLITTVRSRARQAGILAESFQVADDTPQTLGQFLEQVRDYGEPLEIRAVAATPILTSSSFRIDLEAVQRGRVLFSTRTSALPSSPVAPSPLGPRRPE
jgi:uncharacterized protein (DUF3084 family)